MKIKIVNNISIKDALNKISQSPRADQCVVKCLIGCLAVILKNQKPKENKKENANTDKKIIHSLKHAKSRSAVVNKVNRKNAIQESSALAGKKVMLERSRNTIVKNKKNREEKNKDNKPLRDSQRVHYVPGTSYRILHKEVRLGGSWESVFRKLRRYRMFYSRSS